ncbi:aminoglycoside phosphotransferase family protein [Paenibacillus lignilyticus]|uniref:Aminoglycoside phosphotransferase family protein n=1 Tax=Paenibacillus lignilyticus TaxID=1172615 RepID=A0ABS5CCM6_9BACL|nr:aminoglycoside phosphotransferase family protein [Paenibacillus lignilyticus]MBP3961587.1 aminoglycoside phosphotransferase family protein [Paenibacillus lignilyticus]MBP3963743.1 aminoglycoside phosphotransferase family protein [Paenibacillus lignilyticus]
MTNIDRLKPASKPVKMHNNEVEIDASLVRRLLEEQFPEWAELPLTRIQSSGTDNAIYLLGEDLAVRMPRIDWATGQAELEQYWLPKLAPHLPLPIPAPLAIGVPAEGYPWQWAVYRWFKGADAIVGRIDDLGQAAADIAQFVGAMQRIDLGSEVIPPSSSRGMSLAPRDSGVRKAIAELEGIIDQQAALTAWEEALGVPDWEGAGVWIHGDIHAGNVLIENGCISAVIDFGCMGLGDPACDMLFAWSILTDATRPRFRAVLQPDDATWARGRGYALSMGLFALPYYKDTNPVFATVAKRIIDEVLTDFKNRYES